jgi:hypothetical protein
MSAVGQLEPRRAGRGEPSVSSLLRCIVADLQTLVRKEIALQTREIQDRIDGAVASVVQLIAVGAMVGLGGGLLALGLSFGVAQVFLWPTWGGLLAVGGALALGGVIGFIAWRHSPRRDEEK